MHYNTCARHLHIHICDMNEFLRQYFFYSYSAGCSVNTEFHANSLKIISKFEEEKNSIYFSKF